MSEASLFAKALQSLQERGLLETTLRILRCARSRYIQSFRDPRIWEGLFGKTVEERFTTIYLKNLWCTQESASGPGSTFGYTANLRKAIPDLVRQYAIKTVFDAPCGDFNWMKLVVDEIESLDYVGGDIVLKMINRNIERCANSRTKFVHFDIINDQFPDADVWICRDSLFHLSNAHIVSALRGFAESKIKYALITTHKNETGFQNEDIPTGSFRLIDMFSKPFSLDREVLFRIDDWVPPFPPREMCLWSRQQIRAALGWDANDIELSTPSGSRTESPRP